MKRQQLEDKECEALIKWADLYPAIGPFLFHIPNGGSRHILEAAKLKRMGVRRGVPDYFFRRPSGEFKGLWIEMKYGKNKLSSYQKEFFKSAQTDGYKCVVVWSWLDAAIEINHYLGTKGYPSLKK